MSYFRHRSVVGLLTLLVIACAEQHGSFPEPPVAVRIPTELTQHGHTRIDPYYWMNFDKSLTDAYIESEKAYLAEVMGETAQLQSALIAEMNSRLVSNHRSVPTRIGDYYYFREYRKGGQYPLYLRSKLAEGDAPEVLLDVNELAGSNHYYQLGGFSISPDQSMVAFTEDTDGDQLFTLKVRYLRDVKPASVLVEKVSAGVAWSADGESLYYVAASDASHKPRMLKRHRLADASDRLIYEETDPGFHVELFESTRKGKIFVAILNGDSIEYRLIGETGELDVVVPRQEGHRYSARLHNDDLYLLTNLNAPDFRLVQTGLEDAGDSETWREMVAHEPGTVIEDFDVFDRYVVVKETTQLRQRIRIVDRSGNTFRLISFKNPLVQVNLYANPESDADRFRYRYASPTEPEVVIEHEFATARSTRVSEAMVSPGFQAGDYVSERRWFTARDGIKVPISLVYKKALLPEGNPAYLSAYGAYGIATEIGFDPKIISLLDRGVLYGVIHTRGGGELGPGWHEMGRRLNKKNTFSDFIDGTRYLIEAGLVHPDKIVARGMSAGGLVMGVIANETPELYRGIVARMPFVDVVTTMSDDTLPMTVGEYAEWGNPAHPDYYHYLLSYSPYDQVRRQAYPRMLIGAALNDTRVPFYEPLKWLAKLRAHQVGDNPLLIDIADNTGHRGPSDQHERRRRDALELAFVISSLSDDK